MGEKHPLAASSVFGLTGGGAHLQGVCPEQESNPRPFGAWDDA